MGGAKSTDYWFIVGQRVLETNYRFFSGFVLLKTTLCCLFLSEHFTVCFS